MVEEAKGCMQNFRKVIEVDILSPTLPGKVEQHLGLVGRVGYLRLPGPVKP
jgi:hypothetical protein